MRKCDCDWCEGAGKRKDFRQDHGSDGWTETPYKKSAKKKKSKKRLGCPGNDGGAHVYVWVDETYSTIYWTYSVSFQTCAGCLQRGSAPVRHPRR